MGIVVLVLLVFGAYWCASAQWIPYPHPTPAAGATTPPYFKFWTIQLLPGVLLLGLAGLIIYVMVPTPSQLSDGQTVFQESGPLYRVRLKVGELEIPGLEKDEIAKQAKELHDSARPNTKEFVFEPESVRLVIERRDELNAWVSLNFFRFEATVLGKAKWQAEEDDGKGKKVWVPKSDELFEVYAEQFASARGLSSLIGKRELSSATKGRATSQDKLFKFTLKSKKT